MRLVKLEAPSYPGLLVNNHVLQGSLSVRAVETYYHSSN
jgi:hypothetical protein